MKKLFFYLMIICFTLSCSNTTDPKKKKFENFLSEYISENPIKSVGYPLNEDGTRPLKRKIAYPSYQVFFNKRKNKNIAIIKLSPHYTKVNIDLSENNSDSLIFYPQEAKGWYLFKGNPIIVFDTKNISSDYIQKKLNHHIPDSLELQEIGNHIDSRSKVYVLSDVK